MKKKITYVCDKEHCCDECLGHFDPNNEPVCKQENGTYTYEKRFSFWAWLKEKICR